MAFGEAIMATKRAQLPCWKKIYKKRGQPWVAEETEKPGQVFMV